MSPIENFKSKPLVVQRLAFVWCVFAFYGIAYSGSWGLAMDSWGAMPASLVLCVLILTLAWSHFKVHKTAWVIGVSISSVWMIMGLLRLPSLINILLLLLWPQRVRTDIYWSGTAGGLVNYQRLALLTTFIPLSGLGLMTVAFVLALSPAGRAAYGIGRRQKSES